jgi:hydrogenase expression/formation protein HypE
VSRITLEHGDGGLKTRELLESLFLPELQNPILNKLGDSALLPVNASGELLEAPLAAGGHLAVTTDSYVVHPPRFPGGDIGKLAVAGTVNDLAVAGAVPLFLTAGFILEEGLELEELEYFVESMARTAQEAGVEIVAGDTKVVPRGEADGLYINTAGVGIVTNGLNLDPANTRPGDVLIINGGIGEHGVAMLAKRAGLEFETTVRSDCAPLNGLLRPLLQKQELWPHLRFMRDATRGGLVAVLDELAQAAGADVAMTECAVPVSSDVHGACELLGLDPLHLANEGKVVMAVAPEVEQEVLGLLRAHPLGKQATTLGTVVPGEGHVLLKTPIGGTRRLEALSGAPLPRIC